MTDIIVIIVLVVIIGLAVRKVYLNRKRGYTCMSCPSTGNKDCHCD
ncbi:MAG: FeoB-associated Cys-rich membrane protein [Erysipelotrichaceae bacterium]|jgi:hypothetical protein